MRSLHGTFCGRSKAQPWFFALAWILVSLWMTWMAPSVAAEPMGFLQADLARAFESAQNLHIGQKGSDSLIPLTDQKHVFRYHAVDLNTLESLVITEPVYFYRVHPVMKTALQNLAHLNLVQMDMPLQTPLRVDLRVGSKISLESRTRWIDALAIAHPSRKRLSVGFGHRFSENTSFHTFFDPMSTEMLGVLSHRLQRELDLQMLYYFDPRLEKSEFITSLKFHF